MNVGELIEALQKLPQDVIVVAIGHKCSDCAGDEATSATLNETYGKPQVEIS